MYSVFTGPAFRSPEKLTAVVSLPRLGVLVPTSSPHPVQGAQETNGPLSTAWLIQENDVDEVAQRIARPLSKVEDGRQDENAVIGELEQVTGPPKILPDR